MFKKQNEKVNHLNKTVHRLKNQNKKNCKSDDSQNEQQKEKHEDAKKDIKSRKCLGVE